MELIERMVVDHIPMLWRKPAQGSGKNLVIWLSGFSGSKEDAIPQLIEIANAGFYALSFDCYQHGKRMPGTREELVHMVIQNIRRNFWPILTLTAEEFPRVIDSAIERLGITGTVMAGGISMGGDIAVAAAGIDRRIAAVSACIATPDWLRPGSHEPPGEPDAYAVSCYDRCNPLTNLPRYAHHPAIQFQCGDADTQVPPDGAVRFVHALRYPYKNYAERLRVVRHQGVSHQFIPLMLQQSIEWFQAHKGLFCQQTNYPITSDSFNNRVKRRRHGKIIS